MENKLIVNVVLYNIVRSVMFIGEGGTHWSRDCCCYSDGSCSLWLVDDRCHCACVPLGVARRRNFACTTHRWWRHWSAPRPPPPLRALWAPTFDLLNNSYRNILHTSGFDFDLFIVIGMANCIVVPNFNQIGQPTTELWRHIDFSRWRLLLRKSTSGCVFSDGTCL